MAYNSSDSSSCSIILYIHGPVLLYPETITFVSRPVFSESVGWNEKMLVPDTKVKKVQLINNHHPFGRFEAFQLDSIRKPTCADDILRC